MHSKGILMIVCCSTATVTCELVVFAERLAQVEQSISKFQVIIRMVGMCARRAFSFSPRLWLDESHMLLHAGLDNVTWKWRGR